MNEQRRRFCQAAGLALAATATGCGTGASCPLPPPSCSTSATSVGITGADVAMGQAVLRSTPQANVFVCRDKVGLYVVDAACTHHGCDVMFVSAQAGFKCPCHGATYDFNGNTPTSPAPTPLVHYALCVSPSGELIVDTEQQVDSCVRYSV